MKEFANEDLIINRIKTFPKVQIFVHDGKIYYNKQKNNGETNLQNILNPVAETPIILPEYITNPEIDTSGDQPGELIITLYSDE